MLPCFCSMHNSWGIQVTSGSDVLLVEASAAFPSSRNFSAVLDEESLGGTGDVDAAGVAGACLSTSTGCASEGCCSVLTVESGFLLSAAACEVWRCDTPACAYEGKVVWESCLPLAAAALLPCFVS